MASNLQRNRRRVGYGMVLGVVLLGLWYASPGLPVLWAPRASAKMKAAGQALFEHVWAPHDPLAGGDGLGPVFNANSCVACHFQGGVGGSGPNERNVLAFEALPSRDNPRLSQGLVHHFAVDAAFRETPAHVRQMFPAEREGRKIGSGCNITLLPPFDPLRTETVNSTALFGAGWIDRISERAIRHNELRQGLTKLGKELDLDFSTVPPGRARVLADGRVGKFGWRGQFASLREFVAAACANELGLGNPLMEQARPLSRPDYPAAEPDLDRGQFAALVAFVDTLPRPVAVLPDDPRERTAAERGKELFSRVGCAICHVPDLGGVEGIYSDFLLHEVEDRRGPNNDYADKGPEDLPPPEGHPRRAEWKTPPLWGVADSAPYFHDGRCATLEAAILRHRADAGAVTRAYESLPAGDRQALVAFLKTLKAPADAILASRGP